MSSNTYPDSKTFLKKITNNLAKIVLGMGIAIAPITAGTYAMQPTPAEAKETKCVPHYLQGFRVPKDKLENMLEKNRIYKSMTYKYPHEPPNKITNGSMEAEAKIYGVDVKLIFPNYVPFEKSIRHYHAAGFDVYSQREFECIVNDNIEYIKTSAELAMKNYEKTMSIAIAAQEKELRRAGRLKDGENLRNMLDQDVPGYAGIKVRDILFTPDIKIEDFVPKRYYFSEIPALGVTYINAGIIGIDPKARVLDYINQWPTILVHEMTHNNPKIQGYPMISNFDSELWASFPMLAHDDMFHFVRHPYLEDLRKVSKIIFNFDSEVEYEKTVSLNLMTGLEFESEGNYKKLRGYMHRVDQVSKTIREAVFNKYIPEFYTHPLYYSTLNNFLNDDNATFKLMMYSEFEPTLLEGPEKTRDFIQENDDTITKVAKETMLQLKGDYHKDLNPELRQQIKSELTNKLKNMSEEEKELLKNIAERYGLKTGASIDDLINFGIRMHTLGIMNFDITEEKGIFR
ncbi:MAG: hypothetical protein V1914_04710 [archaeon]